MQTTNIQDFVSGAYEQQYQYKSFLPQQINTQWILSDPEILTLMEKANRLLGEPSRVSTWLKFSYLIQRPNVHEGLLLKREFKSQVLKAGIFVVRLTVYTLSLLIHL